MGNGGKEGDRGLPFAIDKEADEEVDEKPGKENGLIREKNSLKPNGHFWDVSAASMTRSVLIIFVNKPNETKERRQTGFSH
jgi:hypothetical protein